MTLSIAQNIAGAIADAGRGNFELGFRDLCTAIDQSAKKHLGKEFGEGNAYKQFLDEHIWIVELMAFPGWDLLESKFGNYPINGKHKTYHTPSFSEIIYHAIRCELSHGDGIATNIKWVESVHVKNVGREYLELPFQVFWGLVAIAVFAKCNSDERIHKSYWLDIAGNKLQIDDFFGQLDTMKRIYERRILRGADGLPLKIVMILSQGHDYPITIEVAEH
jgi:hypothetical protein